MTGYVARPAGPGPHPGLLLVHEIWGLDAHIREVADRFAREGFVVLAPDLYSTHPLGFPVSALERGLGLLMALPPPERGDPSAVQKAMAPLPSSERGDVEKAMAWMRKRDLELYVPDLQASLGFLRGQPGVDGGRVAALGFCMGGAVVWRLAVSGAPVWGSVVFYGDNPPLDRLGMVKGPVLGLYGADDPRITATVPDLERAMKAAGKPFSHHVYAGAPHAFFNDTRPLYRKEAAEDAWRRTLAFLCSG
jgi:carboxymethylenebutenolidase